MIARRILHFVFALLLTLAIASCGPMSPTQEPVPTIVRLPEDTKVAIETMIAATRLAVAQEGVAVVTPTAVQPATPVAVEATATSPPGATVTDMPPAAPASTATATPELTPAQPVEHVVAVGENLTIIARRYGVSVQAIIEANHLSNPSNILVGQKLLIPGASGQASTSPATVATIPVLSPTPQPTLTAVATAAVVEGGVEHVVAAGENLAAIALRYGVTVQAIVQANNLANPSLIWVGQVLRIPLQDGATPAAAVTPQMQANAAQSDARLSGKIAFQVASGGDIYVVNADGSGLRRLTDGLDPAWSPDGQLLALVRWRLPWGLYVISADGSREERIWEQNLLRSPTWSPDGLRLAFTREEEGSPASQLCLPGFGCIERPAKPDMLLGIVNLDGTGREDPLADLRSLAPSWSPSDGWIVYAGETGLRRTRLGDSPQAVLADVAAFFPSVSPDGNRIALMYHEHDHWEIYLVNADGTGLQRLTSSPVFADNRPNNVAPAWSPDGAHILFLSDRDGRWRPYIMAADGSEQQPFLPAIFDSFSFRYDFAAERVFTWAAK